MPVTFDASDLEGVDPDHHDSLVIRIQIGTTMMHRVLIDGGSSVNLIMLWALKTMGLKVEDLIKNTTTLVGFSGETKQTMGQISLPIYAHGVTSFQIFQVIDCSTSYNVLQGRPWIHGVKAVPSTFHQCVKIPSRWGVVTIKGEKEVAQKCYEINLRPSRTNITSA